MDFKTLEQFRIKYLEAMKKVIRRIAIWSSTALLIAIMSITININMQPLNHPIKFIIYLVSMIVAWLSIGIAIFAPVGIATSIIEPRRVYQKAYRVYFIEAVLKNTFERYHHGTNTSAIKDLMIRSSLMKDISEATIDDLIIGEYKGKDFAQCDYSVRSGSSIHKGHWMAIEFKKSFHSRIQVVGKRFQGNILPEIDNYKLTRLESQDFNRNLRVYAQDEVDARYVLNPAIMERMLIISHRHKKKILFGFYDDWMHVIIWGKDSLKVPAPWHQLNENQELQKVSEDLHTITEIIDLIK